MEEATGTLDEAIVDDAQQTIAISNESVEAADGRTRRVRELGHSGGFEAVLDQQCLASPDKTLERRTFAKTVTVVAKTSRIKALQRNYAQIQHELLSGALAPPAKRARGRARTYALLQEPRPELYYETRERLEQTALADALTNARDKLEATLTAGCGATDYDIIRMVESSPDRGRPIAYARSQPASGSATLELDAIWINKLLDVSFMVAPGHCSG